MVSIRQTQMLLGVQTIAIVFLLGALFNESQANPFLSLWVSQNAPYLSPFLDGWIVLTVLASLSAGVMTWIILLEMEAQNIVWKPPTRLVEATNNARGGKEDSQLTSQPRHLVLPHSVPFLVSGPILLAASVFTRMSVFVFAGLGLIFLGMVPVYLRYEEGREFPPTSTIHLDNVHRYLPSSTHAVYLPPFEGKRQPVAAYITEPDQRLSQVLPFIKGISVGIGSSLKPIEAPGAEFLKRLENHLGVDFSDVKPTYLEATLPRTITEDLKLASSMEIVRNEDRYRVRVRGERLAALCEAKAKLGPSVDALGCEFCSAIALSLAKSTGQPILIEDTVVTAGHMQIDTTYRALGPRSSP